MASIVREVEKCFKHGARAAFVATYTPKQCGIATFTSDLRDAVGEVTGYADQPIVAIDDADREYPSEVEFVIKRDEAATYTSAARWLNVSGVEIVCLQHEYGIFGGVDGDFVLDLLRELRLPVVTTLHTILQKPSVGQLDVLRDVCRLSGAVMVMSDRARDILHRVYGVPRSKIEVIPHGVPSSDGITPAPQMMAFGDDPKLLTFGLLSPGKGIEVAIEAIGLLKPQHPNIRYFVLGATHPELKRREGEAYRESLQQLAIDRGLEDNVIFLDKFLGLDELCSYLQATDIYVTPYRSREQICSGTMSYAAGFGLPMVSTPFIYAEELAEKGGGLLFPFGDSSKLAGLVHRLLTDPRFRGRLSSGTMMLGRTMRWPVVGRCLNDLFCNVLRDAEVTHAVVGLERSKAFVSATVI